MSDFNNAFAAFAQGRQVRASREAEQERNALRGYGQGILSGDPAAFDAAAAINPEVAQTYQNAGDSQLRRMKGAIKYLEDLEATGNTAAVEAAYKNQVAPYLNRISPDSMTPPATYAEAKPKMLEAKARIAMLDAGGNGKVFAQKVGADGFIYNAMSDGQMVNTGIKADRQMWLRDHPGMTPELVGKDGVAMPVGASQPVAPAMGTQTAPLPPGGAGAAVEQIMASANQMIARNVPAEQVDAWVQQQLNPAAAVAAPVATATARPSEAQVAAEKALADAGVRAQFDPMIAGQTEAAREAARLAVYPRQTALEADRAGAVAAATAAGKSAADRSDQVRTRVRDAESSIASLEEAVRLLPQATGGMAGAAYDAAAGAAGVSTQGARANAQLKLIAADLVAKVPRFEGPQSNIDVQFYREAAGDLANASLPVETRLAAANKMLELRRKYLRTQGAAPSSAIRRARNPQTGEVLELRNGAWVPVR